MLGEEVVLPPPSPLPSRSTPTRDERFISDLPQENEWPKQTTDDVRQKKPKALDLLYHDYLVLVLSVIRIYHYR